MSNDEHDNRQERPRLVRGRVRDPFWAAVQRRHPEIDIVLLPPEQEQERDRGGEES